MVETVADLQQRIEAVITPNHAFVSASAGTGKTHTLTLRALYLLLTCESARLYSYSASRREQQKAARDSVRSLVLTTFTKKASAEMQDRVFRYLNIITRAGSRAELEEDLLGRKDTLFLEVLGSVLRHVPGEDFKLMQKGAQALIERAPELKISTLHSFASSLLSSYPVESGIPLDAGFQSEDDPAGLDREARLVDIWLQREVLEGSRELSDSLGKVLADISLDSFKSILRECLLKDWLVDALDEFTDTSRHSVITPRLCLEILQAWSVSVIKQKGKLSKAKGIAENLDRIISGVEQGVRGSWTRVAAIILEHKSYMFSGGEKAPKAVKEAISGVPEQYRSLLGKYGGLYSAALMESLKVDSRESWRAFNLLLWTFVKWGKKNLIKETRLVTFDDMISMAARLLREYPEVQAREYARLKSVLVDEFQDTDPVQLELLKNLLTRPAGSEHEVLGFFVGDVKQSIYRFRDADVSAVEDFLGNYCKLVRCSKPVDRIRLQTSFRSDPGIINYANNLFNGLLDLDRPDENLLALKPSENPVPEWRLVDSGQEKENASVKRDSVARAVLAAVNEYIVEKSVQGPADCQPYEDILVLCRNYRELDPIIDTLKRAGVPVISSGSRTFQMNTEVLDTINLLISLLDPLDSLSLASVLKSPVVGLTDARIYRFFQEYDPLAVFSGQEPVPEFISGRERQQLDEIGRLARLRRSCPVDGEKDTSADVNTDEALQPMQAEEGEEETVTVSLDDWICMVTRLIPEAVYHKYWDLEGIAVSRIKKVLSDFMEVSLEAAVPPLVWLLREREKIIHKPMQGSGFSEDISVSDESVRAVRVMSIHKSKGLEGKFVIIASWASLLEARLGISGRGRAGASDTVFDFPVPGRSRMRAFRFKWGNLNLESGNYSDAEAENKKMDDQEVLRLAYVSATRARERLMLLTPASFVSDNKPEAKHILESYITEAVGMNLMRVSTWQVQDITGTAADSADFEEIDAAAYWGIWGERLARLEQARVKDQKTASPRFFGKETKTKSALPSSEVREAISAPHSGEIKKEKGTLVHLYLELHLTDPEVDLEELQALAGIMDSVPANPLAVEDAASFLERFYSGGTRDAEGIPLIERVRKSRILGREFPVMLDFQEESQYRIIDLLLEDEHGITIVDYKTASKPSILPEKYRKQQEVYTRAVKSLAGDRPVRFEFWWLGE